MTRQHELFFDILKYYVGSVDSLPDAGSKDEWGEVYEMSRGQALLGVVFAVVEKFPVSQAPDKQMLRGWMSDRINIDRRNLKIDSAVAKLSTELAREGYRNVLLKGQGAALLYPDPRHRSPGDIDLWVYGRMDDLVALVRSHKPSAPICYHHGEYGKVDGIPVEIHFKPSWLYDPFKNRKLQKFFREELAADKTIPASIGGAKVAIPSADFNAVFMLSHMYKHIFNEGLGLRQLMDYYFVLQEESLNREKAAKVISATGLRRFAGAVMFVLREVFGLAEDRMLVPADESAGAFLLEDVQQSGNFGAIERASGKQLPGRLRGRLSHLFRFLRYYPSEVLWAPLWKTWHYVWRKSKGYCG